MDTVSGAFTWAGICRAGIFCQQRNWSRELAWTLSGSSAYHLWSSKGSWWSSQCANYKETTCGNSLITTEIWEASTGPKGQKKDRWRTEEEKTCPGRDWGA